MLRRFCNDFYDIIFRLVSTVKVRLTYVAGTLENEAQAYNKSGNKFPLVFSSPSGIGVPLHPLQ